MTKDELKPLAKIYFDHNKALVQIFGTEDRHFFYEEIQAKRYCGKDKIYFHFTTEDFGRKKKVDKGPTKESKVESKEKPKEEVKEQLKADPKKEKPKPKNKEG